MSVRGLPVYKRGLHLCPSFYIRRLFALGVACLFSDAADGDGDKELGSHEEWGTFVFEGCPFV